MKKETTKQTKTNKKDERGLDRETKRTKKGESLNMK